MSTIVGFYYNSSIETGGTNALTGTRSGNLVEPAPWVTSHAYAIGDMVSSSSVAYVCNTAHTSGATLAADSAKWDNLGACTQAPISVLNTVYTLYFRTVDSTTGGDPSQDSTSNITFTPPANVQICQTYNGSFTGSALQLSVAATGGNQPIYIKQTSGVTSSPKAINIGALSWTAGTRVAQVGTVTATPTDSTITLSWADISGETGYEVDRATNSGFTANLVHLTTSLAANSTSYVNNSGNGNTPVNGSTYYYRVRGVSASGVGAWSSGVSCAPGITFAFTNNFSTGQSLDTSHILTYTANSGTANVASNKLTLDSSGGVNQGALAVWQYPLLENASRTYELKVTPQSIVDANFALCLAAFNATTIPTGCTDAASFPPNDFFVAFHRISSSYYCVMAYVDSVGTTHNWKASTSTWDTVTSSSPSVTVGTTYIVRLETNGTQVRFTFADSGGTTINQTSWLNLSAIKNNGLNSWWIGSGDPYNNAWSSKQEILWAKAS